MKKDEKIIGLPCSHLFHANCVNVYLEENSNCPVCRTDIEKILINLKETSGNCN